MNLPPYGDSKRKLGAALEMLKVQAQDSPNMTVQISDGNYMVNGESLVEYSGGNSEIISDATSNAKWVGISLSNTGTIIVTDGTESVNPTPPIFNKKHLPLALIYINTGTVVITADQIFDIKPVYSSGGYPTLHNELLNRNSDNVHAIENITDLQTTLDEKISNTDLTNALLVKADTTGTNETSFILNKDYIGTPSSNIDIEVERGSLSNVGIRWNETLNEWQFTNDGTTWFSFANNGFYGDASSTSKGVSKLSIDPLTVDDPIAIGENDPRVFSTTEKTNTLNHLTNTNDPHNVATTLLSSFDLKADKTAPTTPGNFASLNTAGNLTDSQISPSTVTNKADKVSGATNGNLASLDSTGNLVDSTLVKNDGGTGALDLWSASQIGSAIDTRINAVIDAAPTALDTLNEIANSLNDDADFAGTMTTALSNKADKVTGAVAGNFVGLDASGNIVDLGISPSDKSDSNHTHADSNGSISGFMSIVDKLKVDGIELNATADQTPTEIKSAYESNSDTNEFNDAEKTKLTGIENGATADQTQSEIKSAYESNSDTNEFNDAEKTKLTGIENGATSDQTPSEIETAYESNSDTNKFTDAEKTKLTGIEAGAAADQTASEIKSAYESNSDTNEFSDAEQTKLTSIETGATADQTASEIKSAYESNSDTNAYSDADKALVADINNGGTTANRPATPTNYEYYFDTDLTKPIWYSGSNWVDATGTTV